MKLRNVPIRRVLRVASTAVSFALVAMTGAGDVFAIDQCIQYNPGHVYYVAYQSAGPEYLVDLGDRNIFLNATTNLTFSQVNPGDFAAIFSPVAPNLFVGVFGVRNPATRDAILSTNGPKDQTQLDGSSCIGAAQQIDSWSTGLPQFASEVGSPFPSCSVNAAKFPGRVFGSYQDTMNQFSSGNIGQTVAWNLETRLSNSSGVRTAPPKIKFFSCIQGASGSARQQLGFFTLSTNGSITYSPDADGDGLPNVPIGSDINADRCPTVNSTDNTDVDNDNRAVPCDCNDADATAWTVMAEVLGVGFSNKTTVNWTAPADPGGTVAPMYDLVRAPQTGTGVLPAWACDQSNLAVTTATEGSNPSLSQGFLYLVRAQNNCASNGSVGSGRNAPPRVVPACP